jgi:hypothetical protein
MVGADTLERIFGARVCVSHIDADAHSASKDALYLEGRTTFRDISRQLRDFNSGAFSEVLGMKHDVLSEWLA